MLRLIVQPDAGPELVAAALDGARHRIDIAIFRLDRADVERALVSAAARGVSVTALIAFTSRGGHEALARLAQRLCSQGVAVIRTADDLFRYHGKFFVIDGVELWVLGFNFTKADMERSRSFGLVTRDRSLVEEAARLFAADASRVPFLPADPRFLVSPLNARKELEALLRRATSRIVIYDAKLNDPSVLTLLKERAAAGVRIRVLGNTTMAAGFGCRPLRALRLHTRTIVSDGRFVFIGSQSLRAAGLDSRREVGLLIEDLGVARRIQTVFEQDWAATPQPQLAKQPVSLLKRIRERVFARWR